MEAIQEDDFRQAVKVVQVVKALEAVGAYTATDVLSESDTNTFGTSWEFEDIVRGDGDSGYIIAALVASQSESIVPRLTMFLFNKQPTSELDDNAFNTAPSETDVSRGIYVGRIDFPAMSSVGTTDSNAIATPSTSGNIPLPFKCAVGSRSLHGILATKDAFTQTPTENMTVIIVCDRGEVTR